MSVPTQHTNLHPAEQVPDPKLSLVDWRWQSEVLPVLPADWRNQASQLHAFTRTRKLADPADLLRALLAYVLCCGSFRLLGAWAMLLGLGELSDTAWRKRFVRATHWLDWLLTCLVARQPAAPPQSAAERVLLIDSTIIRQPGGKGEDWRLHLGYDLSAAHFATMLLTDDHTAEDSAHYPLKPGDIAVADAGYGRRRIIVQTVLAQQADIVVRIHPRTCPLENQAGQQVDVVAWLQTLKGRYHSRVLFCRHGQQQVQVRLLAIKLNEQATLKAQRRKRKKALTDQRQITAETLYLAGWMLLVTSLAAASWPTDAVVRLYRARWQVELLFKQMKQLLGLGHLAVRNRARAEAVLRAKLVAWALGEQLSGGLRGLLPGGWAGRQRPASSWLLRELALEQLRAVVRGGWSWARLQACLDKLLRYICSSPRQREQQESRIRNWLARRLAALSAIQATCSLLAA